MTVLALADMSTEERARLAKLPEVSLHLKATRAAPRKLSLLLSARRFLYVYLRPPGRALISLAYASDPIDQATLYPKWFPAVLSVSGTHFHLTEAEAVEVERVFAPHGLRIDRGTGVS